MWDTVQYTTHNVDDAFEDEGGVFHLPAGSVG
jgi:hypothetical protein